MASISKTTRDHDEIRRWAEERGGKPAHVTSTGSGGDIGILRLEFPGATASNDASLEPITWDQFFEKFDERGLALLYQEETAEGAKSNFNKLISAATAEAAEGNGHPAPAKKRGRSAAGTSKRTAAKKSSIPIKKAATPARAPVSKKSAATGRGTAKKTTTKKAVATKTAAKKAARSTRSNAMGRPAKKAAKKRAMTKSGMRGATKTAKKAAGRKATVKKTATKGRGGPRKLAARSRR